MRILMMLAPYVEKEPALIELKQALAEVADAELAVFPREELTGEFDLVLPLDEMLINFHNMRSRIAGRFQSIGLSFKFGPLYRYFQYTNGLLDSGLAALICNCPSFVRRIGGALPAVFSYRPLATAKPFLASSQRHFVSVIDEVADQDFALAARVAGEVEKHKMQDDYRIYCCSNDLEKLPSAVRQCAVSCDLAKEPDLYAEGGAYIPTPRVTDYRGGVVPAEYFKALKWNRRPIFPGHQLLHETFPRWPLCKSVKEVDEAIDAAGKTEFTDFLTGLDADTVLPTEVPTSKEFAVKIWTMWQRLKERNG